MFVLVCYDVSDDRRLYRISRTMENFGTRVQRSVFECRLNAADFARLQLEVARLLDLACDKVRYYRLCGKDVASIRIHGPGAVSQDVLYLIA